SAPLVGGGKRRVWHRRAERLCGDQMDDKLELRRLLDGYIAGFCPAKNFIHIIRRAPEPLRVAWSVGHEAPAANKVAGAEDRWKPRAKRKRKDAHEVGNHELIDRNVKRLRIALESREGGTEIFHPPDFDWRDFDAERASRGLGLAHLQHGLSITPIEDDCQSAQLRDNLTQKLYSLASEISRLERQPGDVTFRFGQTCD